MIPIGCDRAAECARLTAAKRLLLSAPSEAGVVTIHKEDSGGVRGEGRIQGIVSIDLLGVYIAF